MVKFVRFGLVLGCLAIAMTAHAAGVLIVQGTIRGADNPDENFNLAQVMAGRFDEDGRVRPVVWSSADPIFRAAIEDGLIRPTDNPTPAEIQEVASKLKLEYVMEIAFWRRETQLLARARLLRKAKEVWADPKLDGQPNIPTPPGVKPIPAEDRNARIVNISVNGSNSVSDVVDSLALTWRDQINAGPLKTVADRPRQDTPAPDPGQGRTIDPPKPPPKVDNAALMTDVMKKMAAGDKAGAIALLRDAIDAEPLDRDRRRALFDALMSAGLPLDAAQQARRAAQILPNGAEFWALAARAWMQVGKETEAQNDLNEAVARDPENAETRLLLGEISLVKMDLESAKRHLDVSLAKGLTAEGVLLRAFHGVLTNSPESAADFKRAQDLGAFEGDRLKRNYDLALRLSKSSLGTIGDAAGNLAAMARRDRQDPALATTKAALRDRITHALGLLEPVPVPKMHEPSDGDRRLALKLLSQFISELETFLQTGDEDQLGDATITLGEGLRRWRDAETKFASETTEELCEAARTLFIFFGQRHERDWLGLSLD